MVFMPPQHGKSELVSRRFPAYMLGRNPDLRLICTSHTHELALAMNRDVQRIIASEDYGTLFPDTALACRPEQVHGGSGKDTPHHAGTAGLVPAYACWSRHGGRWTISRSPAILAPCVRRASASRSPGCPPTARSSTTPSASAKTPTAPPFARRSGTGMPTTFTRGSRPMPGSCSPTPAGTATTWPAGCCGRWPTGPRTSGRCSACRRYASREQGSVGRDSTRSSGTDTPRHAGTARTCSGLRLLPPADKRLPGQALWPAFKSAAELEIIRQQDARAFAALYQQDPAEGSAAEWPAELFGQWIWIAPERWPKRFRLKVVCLDASKGRSDRPGDYSAIVFMGVGEDDLLYVDAILDRIPAGPGRPQDDRLLRPVRPGLRGHRSGAVPGAAGPRVPPPVRRGFHNRWNVYAMMSQGIGKVARIRRLTQYVVNRELRFRADSPGCRLLVDQLMDFPIAEHDDGPDALEMCVRLPIEVRRLQ